MERIPRGQLSLYQHDGRRKYITSAERARFLEMAWTHPRPQVGTLCLILAYTGCRISEALALCAGSLDTDDMFVAIRCLKKRDKFVVREVPIPPKLAARIAQEHNLSEPGMRLWPWSRGRAWALVRGVMVAAQIVPGPHATAKGLRHGFGIHALQSNVPITFVQRWLGHASLSTTAIYLNAIGSEERAIAARMWT